MTWVREGPEGGQPESPLRLEPLLMAGAFFGACMDVAMASVIRVLKRMQDSSAEHNLDSRCSLRKGVITLST
jgi:hypothetical protein